MRQFGLKMWSRDFTSNPDFVKSAEKSLKDGNFGYLELFALPDTYDDVKKLAQVFVGYKTIIHAPHSRQNINLSDPDVFQMNCHIFEDSRRFADLFDASYIILHPGLYGYGGIEENIRQFKALNDSRIVVENLPFLCSSTHRNLEGVKTEDVKKLMTEVGCGLCLDFSHAICGANDLGRDVYLVLNEFKALHPVMYHLCDGDISSKLDNHLHYGEGNYDLKRLVLEYTDDNALITMETGHGVPSSVQPWLDDLAYIHKLCGA